MATFLAASRTVSSGSSRFAAWSIEKPVVKGSEGQVVTDVAPGDVMITTIAHDRNTALGEIPAGWTLLRSTRPPAESNGSSSKALDTYYKLATASEPGSYTWGSGDGTTVAYVTGSVSIRGVDTANPFGAHDGIGFRDAVSSPVVAPSVNVSGSDAILYTIHSIFGGFVSNSPPPEMTGRWFASESSATGLGSTEPRSAGATGTRTAGFSSSLRAAQSIVVRNANRAPTAPGTPTVTPNPVNTSGTIAWPAASDPDGDAVTYDAQLSTDNGANFATIRSAQPGTSFSYDFTNVAATTAAKVRVRARDTSNAVSTYTTSAAFTVQHNRAPNPASWVSPAQGTILDRSGSNILDFLNSEPDTSDPMTKFDLRSRVEGASAWEALTTVATSETRYTVPANAYASGRREFQVLPYDSLGVPATGWSPSLIVEFAVRASGPGISYPLNGGTISTDTDVARWTFAGSQQAYRIYRSADNAGARGAELYPTVEVNSVTARDHGLSFPVNDRYEWIGVQVKENTLWTDISWVRVLVSYTTPPKPIVDTQRDPATGSLLVLINNPAPSGTQPIVESNEVWIDEGETEERRAIGIGSSWRYMLPKADMPLSIRARAMGANGTSSWSDLNPQPVSAGTLGTAPLGTSSLGGSA